MTNKPKLLIVEDEAAILRGLTDLFTLNGYDVTSQQDGLKGLETALADQFDCILLDVMLPTMDGFSICNAIRKQSRSQPIIMLTAKSAEEDIINGLTLGADDYIAKPFSVQELLLRVKTILRRIGWHDEESTLQLTADISLDKNNLSGVVYDKNIDFTRREIDLLTYLHRHKRPVSRAELLTEVWGYSHSDLIDTRTVDIHVAKLRKKIELDYKKPMLLQTFRGEGYKLMDC